MFVVLAKGSDKPEAVPSQQNAINSSVISFTDSNNNRKVGPILKLLNVNGYASLLCQPSYNGPQVKSNPSATDEALPLSDIKGPVTQDKRQVVKQVYYTIHIITTIALLTGKTVKKEKYAFYSNMCFRLTCFANAQQHEFTSVVEERNFLCYKCNYAYHVLIAT